MMKGIHIVLALISALVLAVNESQASSSSAVGTSNLRSHSSGVPNLVLNVMEESNDSRRLVANTKEETTLGSQNERRLPKNKSGRSDSGSGSSSSSSSSGGSGSGSGGSSSSSGGSDSSSESDGTGTGTGTDTTSDETATSRSSVSGFQSKAMQVVGSDRASASVVIATVGGLVCLLLLVSIMAITGYKIVFSKTRGYGIDEDDEDDDNNKAEHLVSASLD